MTTATITDRSALAAALRNLKLSGMLATLDARLAQALAHLAIRPAVLGLDDFAMRELTAPQADDLYELITERAGKSLIVTRIARTRSA